jgi:inner membrane protein
MDNFTHSLVGWALGEAGLKRRTRKGLAALILGANAPDIDVFFGWVPWAPLATHRGITHSLTVGIWVLPLGLAGLLWLFDRWQLRRGEGFAGRPDMRFGWLVALSFIGCLTHPLLDWQTAYAIQLFSPFDTRWYHADTLFIIDVWIWTSLSLAIWLARRRSSAVPARIGLGVLVAYVGLNSVLTRLAQRAPAIAALHADPDTIVASPPPVLFWRRDLVWRQGRDIWWGQWDPFHALNSLRSLSGPEADGMSDPLARKVLRETPELTSLRRWSILPMARIERGRCRVVVRYSDARFASREGGGPMSSTVLLGTDAPGC